MTTSTETVRAAVPPAPAPGRTCHCKGSARWAKPHPENDLLRDALPDFETPGFEAVYLRG